MQDELRDPNETKLGNKIKNINTLNGYIEKLERHVRDKTYLDHYFAVLLTKDEQDLIIKMIEAIVDVKIKTIRKDIENKLS